MYAQYARGHTCRLSESFAEIGWWMIQIIKLIANHTCETFKSQQHSSISGRRDGGECFSRRACTLWCWWQSAWKWCKLCPHVSISASCFTDQIECGWFPDSNTGINCSDSSQNATNAQHFEAEKSGIWLWCRHHGHETIWQHTAEQFKTNMLQRYALLMGPL